MRPGAMLTDLTLQPADALLALIRLFNNDPRPDKIDLGVGVYRTGQGETPVFTAIKEAERRLWETQTSKSYLGPEGDMGFVVGLMPYIFGAGDPEHGRPRSRACRPRAAPARCGSRWR